MAEAENEVHALCSGFSSIALFFPVAHLRNVCRLIKASLDLLAVALSFSFLSVSSLEIIVCALQEC